MIPPSGGADHRVLRPPDGERRRVAHERAGERRARLRPLDEELAHVRQVEQAGGRPDGAVLLDDAGVLDRHQPAGEVDEPARRAPRADRGAGSASRRSAPARSSARASSPSRRRPGSCRRSRPSAARATRARSVSKVSMAGGLGERDPAHLVELVVVARPGRRRSAPSGSSGRSCGSASDRWTNQYSMESKRLDDAAPRGRSPRGPRGPPSPRSSRRRRGCPWGASRSRRRAPGGACRRPAAGVPSTNRMTIPPAEVAVACLRRATPAPRRSAAVPRRASSWSTASRTRARAAAARLARRARCVSARHGARSAVSGPTSGRRSTVRRRRRRGERRCRAAGRVAARGPVVRGWTNRAGQAAWRAAMLCCMSASYRVRRRLQVRSGAVLSHPVTGRHAVPAMPDVAGQQRAIDGDRARRLRAEDGEVGGDRPGVAAGRRPGQRARDPEGLRAFATVCSSSGR